MTKHPIALRLAEVQKLFTIALIVYMKIISECSVFPDEAYKKDYVQNSSRGKCNRCSACV